MTYPKALVQSLISQSHELKLSVVCSLAAAGLSLAAVPLQLPASLARLFVASLGLSAAVGTLASAKTVARTQAHLVDTELASDRGFLQFFSQTLTQQPLWEMPATDVTEALDESTIVSDTVGYWRSQQKHLLVVGGTGDGKSVFVQSFASQLQGWNFRILDTDASSEDWLQLRQSDRTQLFTTNEAIDGELTSQLQELEKRLEEGKRLGWSVYRRQVVPVLSVVEEFLTLAMNVDSAPEYMKRLAVRGRKAQQFIAVVTQNDTQDSLGLSGQASLVNDCFVRVYLGKKAIARAKLLKRPELAVWLQEQGYNGCLVDDMPALRPKPVTTAQLQAPDENQTLVQQEIQTAQSSEMTKTPEDALKQALDPDTFVVVAALAQTLNLPPIALVAQVRKLKLQGLVTLDICRQLGCSQGTSYLQAKAIVEALDARGLLRE